MRTLRMFVGALAIGAVAVGSGCGKGPSTSQCEELLAHITDVEMKSGGAAPAADLTADQKKALEVQKTQLPDHVRTAFMDRCMKEVSKGYVECGLKAPDHDAFAKCEKN